MTQAEALRDLIDAETEVQRRVALRAARVCEQRNVASTEENKLILFIREVRVNVLRK